MWSFIKLHVFQVQEFAFVKLLLWTFSTKFMPYRYIDSFGRILKVLKSTLNKKDIYVDATHGS